MIDLLTAREMAGQQRRRPLTPGDLGQTPYLCRENE